MLQQLALLKGFQLDVGFPHQYMDVHYQLESSSRGYFWLASCGALLEVEGEYPHQTGSAV